MTASLPVRLEWIVAGLLLLLAGCDSVNGSRLASVRGKVFYRGAPLSCGVIVFAPDAVRGNRGPLAIGTIGPDGSYALRSEDAPGAVPGWHRVTVVAVESEQGGGTFPPLASGSLSAPPRSLVPEKYRDPDLSGLACEVKAGRENTIHFHLE